MQSTRYFGRIHRFFNIATRLVIACFLFLSALAQAQDSPGRFEAGGNFTTLRFNGNATFGPGLEGDINFGRHFALDGAYSWLPSSRFSGHLMTGFFGGKVGTRTQHFGFFGKVRPGFVSVGNTLREETILVNPALLGTITSFRFARLTERALDAGGVVEYYPSRHWALRWDAGDTVVFQEAGTRFIIVGNPAVPSFTRNRASTTNNFQFSAGVHYRF